MNFITDILFSTSLRATVARGIAIGISWLLSALSGVAIFAHVELPKAQWLEETATFITALVLALVAHLVSLIGSKKQKAELPN